LFIIKKICLLFPILKFFINYRSEIVKKINCIMDYDIENEIHTDVLVASNMATAPRDMLIASLHFGFFSKNDDVEAFISKCNKYFDASETHKSAGNWTYQ